MALLLSCESLTKYYGPRLLFREISISFDDAERTGMIGANGSGKSTLLKILAGIEQPDAGSFTTRRGLRVGYLPQEDSFETGATVCDVVLRAAPAEAGDEHERLVESQILLDRVGFTDLDQRADSLSGGWRKRLAIARELVRKPDLLLLDEPTNHLDIDGILWLEKLLSNAPFSFLLVSHDRYFLENATNRIVELSRAYTDGYLSTTGSYSEFLEKRETYLEAQAKHQQSLQSQVRREVTWLRRKAKARTTKAKGRIEQAGEMMKELSEVKSRNAAGQSSASAIDFTSSDRKTRKLLTAKNVTKSMGARSLFSDLELILSPGMRLGLLGPNGSGKTTLIKMLAGESHPDTGMILRAEGLRVVRFEQDRSTLDKSQTLREALAPNGGDMVIFQGRSQHVSGWAARFLFGSEQLDLPVSQLSGGEQARVLIARMMLNPADVLILDEPTNDLDIGSLEILEQSLVEFPGALVLVTHDRYMLDRVSNVILAIDGEGGTGFYADYHQWQQSREDRAAERAEQRKETESKSPLAKEPPARKVRLSWKEQRELQTMEQAIVAGEERVSRLRAATEDPAIFSNHVKSKEAFEQLAESEEQVKRLYARWEELTAREA